VALFFSSLDLAFSALFADIYYLVIIKTLPRPRFSGVRVVHEERESSAREA
jgi:hypothetical protein